MDGWWSTTGNEPGDTQALSSVLVGGRITWRVSRTESTQVNEFTAPTINEWGRRLLQFPPWFAGEIGASLQNRIDAYGVPRDIHVIALPVGQQDAARRSTVLSIQPGDFLGVVVRDDITETLINAIVMVMSVRYQLTSGGVSVKILTCLQASSMSAVTFWEWGRSTYGGGDVWR